LPPAARTAFSSGGPSVRHGPHQGAQKSTMTGVDCEASMTSAMKPWSEPSLTMSVSGGAGPLMKLISILATMLASYMGRRGAGINSARGAGDVESEPDGLVAGRAHEFQHVGRADGGGGVVAKRVEVDRIVGEQRLVEDDAHAALRIVDQREESHRSG